jgi:hypothetical protein
VYYGRSCSRQADLFVGEAGAMALASKWFRKALVANNA